MNSELYALLENYRGGESYRFSQVVAELIAFSATELHQCLEKINHYQQQGFYCVGYISYETGFVLNKPLQHLVVPSNSPLLHMLVCQSRQLIEPVKVKAETKLIDTMHLHQEYKAYVHAFDKVRQALMQGNSYQLNLTWRCDISSHLDSLTLYRQLALHQLVDFAAYLPFSTATVLSFSPELFFKKKGENLTLQPMKGTSCITEQAYDLAVDIKNQTENLIIVDLIRNDLARCTHTGTVNVDNYCQVQDFQTVKQMTSTISANCDVSLSLETILTCLFPCGSITGAPKINTMKIINELEPSRGIYTGAIGYITPDNDMCFNVAIRTLVKQGEHYTMGVGGGITLQSKPKEEWQEIKTKLNFIKRNYQPEFNLVESLLFDKHYRNLNLHLQRMQRSAQQLLFEFDSLAIENQLIQFAQQLKPEYSYKVRIELTPHGECNIEAIETNKLTIPERIYLCPDAIASDHFLFRHKSTAAVTRGVYQSMHDKYLFQDNNAELIFYNKTNNITESRYYNVVIDVGGRLLTPHQKSGLLPGTYRHQLLSTHDIVEQQVDIELFESASRYWLINDVRGMIEVKWMGQAG